MCLLFCTRKERMTLNLQNLLSREKVATLVCIANSALVTMLCLATSHNWLPSRHPTIFFCLQLERVFKAIGWAIWGNFTQFFWVSSRYTEGIHVMKLLVLFSPINLLLETDVSARTLKGQDANYLSSLTLSQSLGSDCTNKVKEEQF